MRTLTFRHRRRLSHTMTQRFDGKSSIAIEISDDVFRKVQKMPDTARHKRTSRLKRRAVQMIVVKLKCQQTVRHLFSAICEEALHTAGSSES